MVVWCLLLAIMLLPLGGLSVDLWRGIAVQRQLEAAAQDAAIAGSSGIDIAYYRTTGCVRLQPLLASAIAEENIAMQAGLGPLAGMDISVDPGGQRLTVVLRTEVHLTLLSIVEGGRPLTVTATATSGPKSSLPASGRCP